MGDGKAKYEEIIDWVKKKISENEWRKGARIPSENVMAVQFGVSRQTVRHALELLERDEVVERRKGSGTYVADPEQKVRKPQNRRIALITTYIDEYIFPSIIRTVEQGLSAAGYSLEIAFTYNAVEKERQLLRKILKEDMVDGVIVEPTKSGLPNPNLDLYRELIGRRIPLLFLNSFYPELPAPHVRMDDELAGYMATKHLLDCGHRNIGAVFKSDDGQGHRRYKGYAKALMEEDIRIRGGRIVWIDTEDMREMEEESGKILRRLGGCTACVCYNDEVANRLIGICMEQGMKIPEEMSIIGIDNSALSTYCEIPITSVSNLTGELGKQAATVMLDMLNGKKVSLSTKIKPELEMRNTVCIINHI